MKYTFVNKMADILKIINQLFIKYNILKYFI